LLHGDLGRLEVRCRLGPDSLVEGKRIGEEAVRATAMLACAQSTWGIDRSCLPQAEVMLQHALTTQRIKIESARKRLRVGAHRLREEKDGISPGDVEALEHRIRQDVARDVATVRWQVSVVGERVEAGTWPACFQTVSVSRTVHWDEALTHRHSAPERSMAWAARTGEP